MSDINKEQVLEFIVSANHPVSEWQLRRHFQVSDSNIKRAAKELETDGLVLAYKSGGSRMYVLLNKESK